jgi:hypothetical protein
MYLYECPRQRFIPLYLLVGGCFATVKLTSSMAQRLRNAMKNMEDEENAKSNSFDGAISLFLFIWFIIGGCNRSIYIHVGSNYNVKMTGRYEF